MVETEAPPPRPMLRGERVWLRPIEPEDIVANAATAGDAEVGHFLGAKTPMSRAGSERFATELLPFVGQTGYPYAICLLDGDTTIGTVFLREVDKVNGSGTVGIFLGDRRYLGQGYGTDALNALVDFGFGELRLERIELEVFDYNTRAIRSYVKAGFQTDAVLRHARFHRGTHHDVHLMSILRDDWLALPRKRTWELTGP
ncbi:MAG: GNAT family N-acetyltransferase [Chloroflexota bacterium]|nr:GNAT family N-acetyltransferase [Chloroflexota bacterium]